MPLTTSFKERVLDRISKEPEYAAALLTEGVQSFLDGEPNVGKSLLRDCINGTIGFQGLAEKTGVHVKSLQRMFSNSGNPTTDNLFLVISVLRDQNNISLQVVIEGKQDAA